MKSNIYIKSFKRFLSAPALGLTAALVLGLTTSCEKFLDVTPQGTITDANYWTTEEDAVRGSNGIYNILRQSGFNEGLFPMLDIMSDDARKGSNPADALANVGLPFEQFQLNSANENVKNWYNTLYVGVRRANAVIEFVPRIGMPEARRNRIIGEGYFFRALFYLDLARGYGNVPFVTSTNPPSIGGVRQATDVEIYNEIIKPDLLKAIDLLPSSKTYTGNDVGRTSKGAAQALLARAALYFAAFHRETMADEFAVARDKAIDCINSGDFDLMPDYSDAFRAQANFSVESVLEVGAIGNEPNGTIDQGGNSYGNVQGVRIRPNKGWGFKRPTISLLHEYDVDPGDSRKEKTIIRLGEVLDGVTIAGDVNDTPDFTLNADGDTVEYELYNEKVWTPGINVPSAFAAHRRLIRFADVLLMAAEGLIETNTDLPLAASYINRVRARARNGVSGVVLDISVSDQATMRNQLYHERRVELGLEDQRYFELVRTRRTELMEPMGFKKGKHEHLPIPQVEIDISGGILKQNPNY